MARFWPWCCCDAESSSSSSDSSGSGSEGGGPIEPPTPCNVCTENLLAYSWELVVPSTIGPYGPGTYVLEPRSVVGEPCRRIHHIANKPSSPTDIRAVTILFSVSFGDVWVDLEFFQYTPAFSQWRYRTIFYSSTINCEEPITVTRLAGHGDTIPEFLTIEPIL